MNGKPVNPIGPLAGRIFLSLVFLVGGIRSLLAFAGTVAYFGRLGFPLPEGTAVLVIAIELVGAVLLLIGYATRWVSWLLIAFVIVAMFAGHRFWEHPDPAQFANQMDHFLKNLAIIGGLLMLAAFGPGRASVDKS